MNFEAKVLELIQLKGTIMRNLPKIEGTTFADEEVYLDFKDHENCEFVKCTLIINYGFLRANKCNFKECRFSSDIGSSASGVLQLDRMLRESALLEENK